MTPIWGMTEGGEKRTGRNIRALPATVIYDPELTIGLPVEIAGPSAMNALAHAAEGLYAKGANPVTSLVALEAVRVLSLHVPLMCAAPNDVEQRSYVLYGAYLAGSTLAVAGTDLHHRTNHILGGLFDLDHGKMNAVVLPYALAVNRPAIAESYDRLSQVMGGDAARAVYLLARRTGSPRSLAEIGMRLKELSALSPSSSSHHGRMCDHSPRNRLAGSFRRATTAHRRMIRSLGHRTPNTKGKKMSPIMSTDQHLAEVQESFSASTDPRLGEIMRSLVTHLHSFVVETGLTREEWMAGIQFLTSTATCATTIAKSSSFFRTHSAFRCWLR